MTRPLIARDGVTAARRALAVEYNPSRPATVRRAGGDAAWQTAQDMADAYRDGKAAGRKEAIEAIRNIKA